jgi:hypothetical protein
MLNNRYIGRGNRLDSQEFRQTFLLGPGSTVKTQEHKRQGGASRYASAAVDQNTHNTRRWLPLREVVQGSLKQQSGGCARS